MHDGYAEGVTQLCGKCMCNTFGVTEILLPYSQGALLAMLGATLGYGVERLWRSTDAEGLVLIALWRNIK